MDLFTTIIIILGLGFFEVIVSVDNAIVNADVLSKMSNWSRKWFITWGFLVAVVVVRGVVPWLILYASNPDLGMFGALTATFSSDPKIVDAVKASAPILMISGGTFLVLLFLYWFFIEPKNHIVAAEELGEKQRIWFYAIASIVVAIIVWKALKVNPLMAFGAVIGSTVFFVTTGFKESAEKSKDAVFHKKTKVSDYGKIVYLEVLDATFSVDSVLGAFAFTLSVPLILLGNGLGVLVVRKITLSNVKSIKKYKYLKNGAMYSIFILSTLMILDAFGYYIPDWVSPIVTFTVVGYFFYKSSAELKKIKNAC